METGSGGCWGVEMMECGSVKNIKKENKSEIQNTTCKTYTILYLNWGSESSETLHNTKVRHGCWWGVAVEILTKNAKMKKMFENYHLYECVT